MSLGTQSYQTWCFFGHGTRHPVVRHGDEQVNTRLVNTYAISLKCTCV
uniref:Uncharacterized protein n=1 Tax=Anguilla anguilla TaxID=7936 RepID=A0A0E9R4A4_ANGAN